MTKRMVASALFAGCAAGLIAALLHFAFVQKYILLGEQYETGALTHFTSGSGAHDAAVPHAEHAATEPAATDAATTEPAAHTHGADHHGSAPSNLQRNALTVLFMGLVYTAYALLLIAGFAIAETKGRTIDAQTGLLWGLAGFAAFQLAPAMGLAPELPGTIAAELGARQIWWWGTVIATGAAAALLAYGNQIWRGKIWPFALGGALLALPHGIGAPQPEAFFGVAPPEVAAAFTARVLGTGLIVWAALGWLAGHFWSTSAKA